MSGGNDTGIGSGTAQGDARLVDVLERMGATVERTATSITVQGGYRLENGQLSVVQQTLSAAALMMPDAPREERVAAWEATRALVRTMNAAGARHHDLNVKNVLLAPSGSGLVAYLLDVDRVTFGGRGASDIAAGNSTRLLRSARKWRDERGAVFDEREIAALGRPLEAVS